MKKLLYFLLPFILAANSFAQTVTVAKRNDNAATTIQANNLGNSFLATTNKGELFVTSLGLPIIPSGTQDTNLTQLKGVSLSVGNGASGTGVIRVTVADDSTGLIKLATGANTIGALVANQSVNVAQINGVTPLMGAGNTGTGSSRVTIATDQAAFTTAVPANQTQVNGVAVSVGSGSNGTGVQRVSLPTDQSTLFIEGSTAHDAVGTAVKPVMGGVLATTTSPTKVSQNDIAQAIGDTIGRQIVAPFGGGDLVKYVVSSPTTSTAEATVIAAPGANLRLIILECRLVFRDNIAQQMYFRDGAAGTIIDETDLFASSNIGAIQKTFPGGLPLSVNNAFRIERGGVLVAGSGASCTYITVSS